MEVRGSLSTGKSRPESDISSERVQPTQPPAGQTAEKRLPEAMTRHLQTYSCTLGFHKSFQVLRICYVSGCAILSLSTLVPAFPSAR